MTLLLRHDGTEYVIGEGQLRNVDVRVQPDLDITAFGDLDRTFIRSNRTHITIDLEIERASR